MTAPFLEKGPELFAGNDPWSFRNLFHQKDRSVTFVALFYCVT